MRSQKLMAMSNMRTPEWGRQWEQSPLMVDQSGVVRDTHWESHLVQNMDLREDPLLRY